MKRKCSDDDRWTSTFSTSYATTTTVTYHYDLRDRDNMERKCADTVGTVPVKSLGGNIVKNVQGILFFLPHPVYNVVVRLSAIGNESVPIQLAQCR